MIQLLSATTRSLLVLLGFLLMTGCTGQSAKPLLRLATTTSTRDSGLLDAIVPKFEEKHHCRVDVVAVGSGAALKLGEQGDADVLLVHAPGAELQFLREGHGGRRQTFMYNYFTILGPADDPAGIRDKDVVEALRLIGKGTYRFVSRGDESGTHKKECSLWDLAGGRPTWGDCVESGQGMGATLVMADEMRAYVLSDRGTWLNFQDKIDLVPLVDRSDLLRNDYSVIVVDAGKNRHMNPKLAGSFLEFLMSEEIQQAIDQYQLHGQPAFHASRPTPR